MVKHRQLACQVGACGAITIESSMDLDNTIFSTGSTFTFGSWIYEADNKSKLQGRLLEDQENQKDFTLSVRSTEELTERFSCLAMSESIQVSLTIEFNSDSGTKSASETNLGSFHGKLGSFPMGLQNIASIHQEINSCLLQNSSIKDGPLPVRTQQHGKVMPDSTPRSSWISARGTTHKSLRGPRIDHDSTRASSTGRVLSLGMVTSD
jgi:hypothetical protein